MVYSTTGSDTSRHITFLTPLLREITEKKKKGKEGAALGTSEKKQQSWKSIKSALFILDTQPADSKQKRIR